MTRASADHQPATLVKYARKVYDVACRINRALPTEDADATLRTASEALRAAFQCHAGQPRHWYAHTAGSINRALDSLNALRARRGEEPVTL